MCVPIYPVFFGDLCVCARVYVCVCASERQEECVFEPLQYRGLITSQDASASGVDLSVGGPLLSRELKLFGI